MNRCPTCYEIAPCTRCLSPHPAVTALRDYRGLIFFLVLLPLAIVGGLAVGL